MDTELGYVTHEYHYCGGQYYRRRLFGQPHWQVWVGRWEDTETPPD